MGSLGGQMELRVWKVDEETVELPGNCNTRVLIASLCFEICSAVSPFHRFYCINWFYFKHTNARQNLPLVFRFHLCDCGVRFTSLIDAKKGERHVQFLDELKDRCRRSMRRSRINEPIRSLFLDAHS